jgi:hypothetical protein
MYSYLYVGQQFVQEHKAYFADIKTEQVMWHGEKHFIVDCGNCAPKSSVLQQKNICNIFMFDL